MARLIGLLWTRRLCGGSVAPSPRRARHAPGSTGEEGL